MPAPKQLQGHRPPYQGKPCPVSRRALAKMLHYDKLQLQKIYGHFGVGNTVLAKWLKLYDLDPKVFVDFNTALDAEMYVEDKCVKVRWIEASAEVAVKTEPIDDELRPADSQPTPSPAAIEEMSDLDRQWLMLPEKAREVITFISSLSAESTKMNDDQIAQHVGIARQTMTKYRADLGFKMCLNEAITGNLKLIGTELWASDMMARYHDSKTLTKDDRALMARVLGLEKQGMNINLAVTQGRGGSSRINEF